MHDFGIRSQTPSRNFILIAGLLLYCGAFAVLLGNKNFEVAGALVVLVVFGMVLPFIAWIATRSAIPLSVSIKPSGSELIVLSGYIIALSLYLIGAHSGLINIYRVDGPTRSGSNPSLRWRKS